MSIIEMTRMAMESEARSRSDLEVLKAVRRLLSKEEKWISGEGWTRSKRPWWKFWDQPCYCVGAAINVAMGYRAATITFEELSLDPMVSPTIRRDRIVKKLGFDNFYYLTEWNDDPNTTHTQVLDRIDATIRQEELDAKRPRF